MEVYNFVDYDSKQRRNIRLNFKLPQKETRIRTFDTKEVFSFRSFLIRTGSLVSDFTGSIKNNGKKLLIILAALTGTALLTTAALKILDFSQSHTSPLELNELQEAEIARLDKMMADFAIENYSDINEFGDLSDTSMSINAILSEPVSFQTYKVKSGDTISGIAKKFGLTNISTLISINDIGNVRTIGAGQKLKIPSMDGIMYTVKSGEAIGTIASRNGISVETLLDVNDLASETLHPGQVIFLPGAKLDQKTLSLAMGDQFICPIRSAYRLSSPFGARKDPFSGKASYHKGQDYACPTGTPIYASMSGKVIYVGETWLYGKHIIIDHGNGYQTLYAHMSKTIATKNQWVTQGTRIGLVGSTGYSTGPHLHFTVYKKGTPVNPMSVLK